MALPLCVGGRPLGSVKVYLKLLLSPGANFKSTKRMLWGVLSRGTALELATALISLMLLGSPPPSNPPRDSPMLDQPNAPNNPESLFFSMPTTPPLPWPPMTPFRLTSSNGAWFTSEPSNTKDPVICAYPIMRTSGLRGLGGCRWLCAPSLDSCRSLEGFPNSRIDGFDAYSDMRVSVELLLIV